MRDGRESFSNIIDQNIGENYLHGNYYKLISWKYEKNGEYNNSNKKYQY